MSGLVFSTEAAAVRDDHTEFSERQAVEPSNRCWPRRASAQYMSPVRCDACTGRDHPKLGKAGNVVRVKDLGVLDAEAVVGLRLLGQRGLELIERGAVGAVANGMHVELESATQRLERDLLHRAPA